MTLLHGRAVLVGYWDSEISESINRLSRDPPTCVTPPGLASRGAKSTCPPSRESLYPAACQRVGRRTGDDLIASTGACRHMTWDVGEGQGGGTRRGSEGRCTRWPVPSGCSASTSSARRGGDQPRPTHPTERAEGGKRAARGPPDYVEGLFSAATPPVQLGLHCGGGGGQGKGENGN